jgi:hypothetical protein
VNLGSFIKCICQFAVILIDFSFLKYCEFRLHVGVFNPYDFQVFVPVAS